MQTLTTTELARSIGRVVLDVQREPVTITAGRRRQRAAVIVGFAEFMRLREAAEDNSQDLNDETCYACGDGAIMWSEPLAVPGLPGSPARLPSCSVHWQG